jgi:hypothetical protein
VFFTVQIKGRLGGEEVEGVGVMKDEELQLEYIESYHTLGCLGLTGELIFIILNR